MSCLVIGIDEAGYGPTLGPLLVGAVVFDLSRPRVNLWKSLGSVITQDHYQRLDKLIVCDSKKVYQPARGIGLLEETVLTFLRQWGFKNWPIPARQLIKRLDPLTPHNRYYEGSGLDIPLIIPSVDIEACALVLQKEMKKRSIRLVQVICKVMEVAEFNKFIETQGNKAELLFSAVIQLVKHIQQAHKTKHLEFNIGKQGGRTYYRGQLTGLFGRGQVRTIKETAAISAYRIITQDGTKIYLRFIRDGEEAHFTIALASMYAKYLREVLMKMFNSFYQQYMPGLKPTAGYPQDAKRFIKDITPIVAQLNHSTEMFVRAK